MRATSLVIFAIVSAVLAGPLPRTLPTPVDTDTAKTYLSQRKYLINSVKYLLLTQIFSDRRG